MKKCPNCQTDKDREDFYPISKSDPKGKLYTYCKECTRSMRKKIPQADPEPIGDFEYTDGNSLTFGDLGKTGMIVGIQSAHDPDEALAVKLPPEQITIARKWQDRLICLQERKDK